MDVTVYTKPISKFLYLHGKSSHPPPLFTGIIKGEIIRFLRSTSDELTWLHKIKFLITMFIQRGYPYHAVHAAVRAIKFADRDRYLAQLPRQPPPKHPIR